LGIDNKRASPDRRSPASFIKAKGEAAAHSDLSGQVALWVGHNNLNAPPAVQNDGCVFGTKRLVEDAIVGLDLTVR